ncbi:MAG: DUF481 domain-containing protein, partial [Moritella sp.]|uniref:DUF481 domain-containing protein n=1 Tax=Moritella sp. TaxID=78556 RepID=UPI0029B89F7B
MKSLSRTCLFIVTLVAAPITSVWAAEDTESKKPEPVKITSENLEIETTEFKIGESKNPDLEKTELKAGELEKATKTDPKDDPKEIESSIVKVKTVESTTVESTTTADIVVKPISIHIPGEPKYFDWILLTNGELLKGEIISMYQDSMDFDSDELGSIDIDMDDISELRGSEIMSIRFSNDEVVEGKMVISNGKMSFMERPNKVFKASDILGIAASEASGKSLWAGDVSLGVNYRSGNTEKFDYSGQIKLSRLTATDRILINTATNYSKIKDAETGEDVRTIQNTRISASYDWFYSRKIFFRLPAVEYYTDEFKNID